MKPLSWKIETLRGQLVDFGSAIRQLQQSGLDSASAQLLISRKRAELEDLINQVRSAFDPSQRHNGKTRPLPKSNYGQPAVASQFEK